MSETFDLDALLEEDSKKYQAKELREHILELPDTYIGSTEPSPLEAAWIATECDDEKIKYAFVQKDIQATMGLYKIFDEILTNSSDNVIRTRMAVKTDKTVQLTKTIKVDINEDGSITVHNDGDGIPVIEHKQHKVLIPEMIFGQLLTSGNYIKGEERRVGGKNGYGSKLCSLFSTRFELETVDHRRKKKFKQVWEDNMSEPKQKAKVSSYTGKAYTKVTFYPDYKKFDIDKLSDDMISLLRKRVFDIAGCTPADVAVYLDGYKIPVKNFEQYVNLYIGSKTETKRVHETPNEFWEVIACASPDGVYRQVSFVNAVCTIEGGKHTDYISNQISRNLTKRVNEKGKKTAKKKTDGNIQTKHIKSNLWIFVNCSIVNPSFSSQTKVSLTTPQAKFGSKCDLSDDFLKQLERTEIVERARMLKGFHDKAGMSKTDGKKIASVRGIDKLDDANWAGKARSAECTLILTEGDSAKSFAVAGISVIGRDKYGVFPLRGKPLNVRDATAKQLLGNAELENLKKILGLQQGKKYTDLSQLRYGKILVLTDQDLDGSHIKGLVINMIDHFWPELQELGFIISMHTPIVKIFKQVRGKRQAVKTFYTLQDYRQWKMANPWVSDDNVKYYKGLATSKRQEAIEYFQNMSTYVFNPTEASREKIDMAFNKKRADNRKTWLKNYVEHNILDSKAIEVDIDQFIDKDLIHFSNYDNQRSIPSMLDGFKPSQRKAFFGMCKMNIKNERKIADIQGPIMSSTHYHHGDTSMTGTITGMADNYVGSNNINLFYPGGMFGTRLQGGKDCGSARYVETCLEKVAGLIFRKEDEPLLEILEDDGTKIEPRWYLPVLPLILVNGAHGIGTGFSTHVPCFNPKDLISALRLMVEGKKAPKLKPWYRGFEGTVVSKTGKWFTEGKFEFKSQTTVLITELPIGIWTDDYHSLLDKLIYDSRESDKKKKTEQCLVSYKKEGKEHNDISVRLTLTFRPGTLNKFREDQKSLKNFKKIFKLEESKSCSVTNLHMFDPLGRMVKFKTVDGILRSFFRIRLPFYVRRREYQILSLERDLKYLDEKVRFIEGIVAETIQITKKSDPDVLIELRDTHKFLPNPLKDPITIRPISKALYDKALEGEIFTEDEDTDISSAPSDADTDSESDSDSDSDSSDSSDSEDDMEDEENEIYEHKDEHKIERAEEMKMEDEREPRKILNEDFDYLIAMQIRTLTKEKAESLKAERTKKANELEHMRKVTPRQIWLDDLNQLESGLSTQGY